MKGRCGVMAAALDLGSNVAIREGASPLSRTKGMRDLTCFSCYYCNKFQKIKSFYKKKAMNRYLIVRLSVN